MQKWYSWAVKKLEQPVLNTRRVKTFTKLQSCLLTSKNLLQVFPEL
jgi:hypothetical protein